MSEHIGPRTPSVEVVCDGCGKHFLRAKSRIESSKKAGRTKIYCSRECSSKHQKDKNWRTGKTVTLKCDVCGKEIVRSISTIRKGKNRGRKRVVCSRECAGSLVPRRSGDKYSPFRWFYSSVKRSIHDNRRKSVTPENSDITVEDLFDIWNSQGGICPLTGWELILPENTAGFKGISDDMKHRQASVDRIDSSLGYTKENVRFVSVIANYAKNKHTDEQLIEFCRAVVNHSGVL